MAGVNSSTCKSCKYWGEERTGASWDELAGARLCLSPKIIERPHFPECNTDAEFSEAEIKLVSENADRMVYEFNEGGGFYSGPKFGCVHWAAKGGAK